MTNKEKNVLKVLEAIKENSYALSRMFEKDGDKERASEYIREAYAYDFAINIIRDKRDLQEYARILKVDLE